MNKGILFTAFMLALAGCRASLPVKPAKGGDGGAEASYVAHIKVEILNEAAIRAELGDKLTGYRFIVQPVEGTNCVVSTNADDSAHINNMDLTKDIIPGCDYAVGVELGSLSQAGTRLDKVYYSNWDLSGNRFPIESPQLKPGRMYEIQLELPKATGGKPVAKNPDNSGNNPDVPGTPVEKRREVVGYYFNEDTGSGTSLETLNKFGGLMSVLAPSWYNLSGTGVLQTANDGPVQEALTAAKAFNLKVVPLVVVKVADAGVIDSDAAREAAANALVAEAKAKGYDGFNLLFESVGGTKGDDLVSFVDAVSKGLRAEKKMFILSVYPRVEIPDSFAGAFDYEKIHPLVDRLEIMVHDKAYPASAPGPLAPESWVRASVKYALDKGVPSSKILIGVVTHGYDWPSGGTGVKITEKAAQKLGNANGVPWDDNNWDAASQSPFFSYKKDNVDHKVYFENGYSAAFKFRIVEEMNLRGVAVYRMGGESDLFWSKLKSIFKL